MVDVKNALEEAGGDAVKAEETLRKKGIAKAVKKAERSTGEGVVHAYIHGGGKIGVLVEVLCETDFVARTEAFQSLVHDLALHIAAMDPLYLSSEIVPPEVLEKEKEILMGELKAEGKPVEIIAKILDGKVQKYYSEVCLLNQPYFKDDKKTVAEVMQEAVSKLGENIQISRFTRYVLSGGSRTC
ncbi:MAG: Elongation factor Ts [Candidatus Magasanikbacteria bacterium]|nr:Elongation factor Ts [Candidatus Magasanikbacteria bacterium]